MQPLKELLLQEELTCIVLHQNQLYKEKSDGILPLFHFIEQGVLQESELADKVVGKAAALLMVYGGIHRVHACLISQHALHIFQKYHVHVTYDTLVPYIINRNHDGMCPIEQAVLTCDSFDDAYSILKAKLQQMQIKR